MDHHPVPPLAPSPANDLSRPVRIGMIRNPRSHRNKALPVEGAALPLLPETVSLAMPTDRAALAEALARFAAEGIDVLAIDGGDGTIRDVLTAGAAVFGDTWPRLLLVPKGKTNALAVDLGLPPRWQLADALRAAQAGRSVVRRPLRVERDGGETLLGFIFGAGAFNAAIATGQTAHRFGAFQGFAIACTAALGVMQALFGIGDGPWRHTARMRIAEVGDETQELPHSGLGAAAARYLALFSPLEVFPARIAPFRLGRPGIRYLLIDAPLRRVTAQLPAILWGRDTPAHPRIGVHRGTGEGFTLDLAEGFILDGEAFAPCRLRLLAGPALSFIVP